MKAPEPRVNRPPSIIIKPAAGTRVSAMIRGVAISNTAPVFSTGLTQRTSCVRNLSGW